jgi:hypothetical protein
MKTLISAIALLVGSHIAAMAADQTLKFKLMTFYIGEKGGENHFLGATVSPDGTIGTKDFCDKQGENGASIRARLAEAQLTAIEATRARSRARCWFGQIRLMEIVFLRIEPPRGGDQEPCAWERPPNGL